MDDNFSSHGSMRLAKACSICRRKKIKCDGNRPICSSCRAFDLPCQYDDGTRLHRKHNRETDMAGIEKRVQLLEHKISQTPPIKKVRLGSASEDPSGGEADARDTPDCLYEGDSGSGAPRAAQSSFQNPVERGNDQGSYVLQNTRGAMRFFGASSHFSIVSPGGVFPLEKHTGNHSLRNIAQQSSSKWRLVDWYPQGLQQDKPFDQRCSLPLPPKHLLHELVREYFQSVNLIIPLFAPTAFMKLVDRQFSWNPSGSPSWWAALNIVVAFAYRNRAEKPENNGDEWRKCIGHIKNAMSVVTDLYMRTCDLLAVQAMIGLALFFQGTPNPQPLFMFTAAAIRFSQSMGLHRAGPFGLSEPEVEERQRVFWVAFMLDADICSRTGRPAAQDIRDFDIALPSNDSRDGLGIIESQGLQVNLFAILAHFAFLQRRIYDLLFATDALKKPMSERIDNARVCIGEVDRWKESIPYHLRPQRDFSAERHPFLPHIIRLHFACHCCYINIYRVFILSHQQPQGQEDESSRDFIAHNEAAEKSLEAARSAIDLISQIEDHHFGQSFEWSIVYFPAAATVALFSQIMLNPWYAEAESDHCLITRTIKFLSKLAAQEQDTYVDYVLSLCCGFEKSAREVIDASKLRDREKGEETRSTYITRSQSNTRLSPLLEREGVVTNDDIGLNTSFDGRSAEPSLVAQDDQDDQSLHAPDPFSLPAHLFWNWQDMLAGVPPAYDFGVQDFHDGAKSHLSN